MAYLWTTSSFNRFTCGYLRQDWAAIIAVTILGEKISLMNRLGVAFIAMGAIMVALG